MATGRLKGLPLPHVGVTNPALERTWRMKVKRLPTIHSRLVLLVMACVIPGALMVVGLISHNYHQGRTALIQASLATARAMVSTVDRELAGTRASLLALSTSQALEYDDFASFYERAKLVLKTQGASSIFLLDPTFQQRVNTLLPFGSKPPPTVDTGCARCSKRAAPSRPISSRLPYPGSS